MCFQVCYLLKSTLEIEFETFFPVFPYHTLLIEEKVSTRASSVFHFAGFNVVSNLLKVMHDIVNEVPSVMM